MLTKKQIQFLDKACPNKWEEENGVINVNGDVNMRLMYLTQIPVQFGKVNGHFNCGNNQLTTLEGAPTILVGWNSYFNCSNNKLTTLKGIHAKVRDNFDCDSNELTNLEGGPKEVVGFYSCSNNKLTNLIYASEICNDNFYCNMNQLTNLEGCPRIIKGNLYCNSNPDLHILYGIGHVEGKICYDNKNDLNEWIIKHACKNIFLSYSDIAEWIKRNNKLKYLLYAQPEIRQHFSPRILHLADSGFYNESRILNYKKFSRIC